MPEELTGEMPTQPTEMEGKAEAQTSAEMVQISAAELAEIRAALKRANGEAAKYRKSAEQIEAERKAKEEAEMTELQKWQRKAQELEQAVTAERRSRLQQEVAAKVGLPAKLASRLRGDTPEEMEADAAEILDTLPKPTPPAKPGPGIVPTNPGTNGSAAETYAQKKERLLGGSVNIWEQGGGVKWYETPKD